MRNLDDAEHDFLDQIGMKAYFMKDVKNIGLDKIIHSIIKNNDQIYHLSFDIDALDSKYASSTGTPEPDGLSVDECLYIIEKIKKTNNLKHFDFVEYNPFIGNKKEREMTLTTCLSLLNKYLE